MEKILEKLYYGELRPGEQTGMTDAAYLEVMERKIRKEEKLRSQLTGTLLAEYDSWMEDYLKLISMESCQTFCAGVRLGARLMAELGCGTS